MLRRKLQFPFVFMPLLLRWQFIFLTVWSLRGQTQCKNARISGDLLEMVNPSSELFIKLANYRYRELNFINPQLFHHFRCRLKELTFIKTYKLFENLIMPDAYFSHKTYRVFHFQFIKWSWDIYKLVGRFVHSYVNTHGLCALKIIDADSWEYFYLRIRVLLGYSNDFERVSEI